MDEISHNNTIKSIEASQAIDQSKKSGVDFDSKGESSPSSQMPKKAPDSEAVNGFKDLSNLSNISDVGDAADIDDKVDEPPSKKAKTDTLIPEATAVSNKETTGSMKSPISLNDKKNAPPQTFEKISDPIINTQPHPGAEIKDDVSRISEGFNTSDKEDLPENSAPVQLNNESAKGIENQEVKELILLEDKMPIGLDSQNELIKQESKTFSEDKLNLSKQLEQKEETIDKVNPITFELNGDAKLKSSQEPEESSAHTDSSSYSIQLLVPTRNQHSPSASHQGSLSASNQELLLKSNQEPSLTSNKEPTSIINQYSLNTANQGSSSASNQEPLSVSNQEPSLSSNQEPTSTLRQHSSTPNQNSTSTLTQHTSSPSNKEPISAINQELSTPNQTSSLSTFQLSNQPLTAKVPQPSINSSLSSVNNVQYLMPSDQNNNQKFALADRSLNGKNTPSSAASPMNSGNSPIYLNIGKLGSSSETSTNISQAFPINSNSTIHPHPQNSFNASIKLSNSLVSTEKRNRLVILYDKPRFSHSRNQIEDLSKLNNEELTVIELSSINDFLKEIEESKKTFYYLNLTIEYNDEFESNLKRMTDVIEGKPKFITNATEIGYHFHFDHRKKWSEYKEFEKKEYKRFLDVLNQVAGEKVAHCSVINKYELNTVYLTERNDLAKLGQEIQDDIQNWKNLRIFDYGENFIRFLPGVKFPNSLEVINLGGGFSLETLAGFKMPPKLKVLIAYRGSISSLDNVSFPYTLERLSLVDNKIYFLDYVEFPPMLLNLDISQNRIESLKGVNFPRNLKSLSVSFNPIECIRGAKFPDGLVYLDLSCIPNESMTGVKFPELLISLNLQQSMTNTRGLKLPSYLKELNMGCNGVNSINPLKLPNTIESLYLAHNNIKTLNKVQFPTSLRQIYLGNNLITTLKNVQFPDSLELLDFEIDPDFDEHEKHITTLKDVIFPPNLKVLKLGYHSIKLVEGVEFPYSLESLSLAYNELKVLKNCKFGDNLKVLDLSGNQELTNLDQLLIPQSLVDLRISSQLVNNLPPYIVERANKGEIIITKSEPFFV